MAKLNQIALQTGMPKGTYKYGDPHPSVKGIIYRSWRNDCSNSKRLPERWSTIENARLTKKREAKYSSSEKRRNHLRNRYETDPVFHAKEKARSQQKGKARYKLLSSTEKGKAQIKRERTKWLQTPAGRRYIKRCRAVRNHKYKNPNLTKEERLLCMEIYDQCRRINKCLQLTKIVGNAGIFVVDHIIPLNKGGIHEPSNLQIAPYSWNNAKGDTNNDIWPYWHQTA